ncbi:amino acid adenylation domain-containing protein [Nocardia sp. NPDC058658]|uniref:amino acid adenylation domain-containing protein n=1 Tax=Nocardia sp. NPDC058658 TaxID=3346580 RepID=UPI003648A1DB
MIDDKRQLLERLLRARAERELSHGERGLWLHSVLAPDSASYNLLYLGRSSVPIDDTRLRSALSILVRRHELLGTTFREVAGKPVAVPNPETAVPVRSLDATDWTSERVDAWLDAELAARIDLRDGPILGVTILRRGADEHLLVLTVAHVVVDFWSLDIVLTELAQLYRDPSAPLPAVGARYADYVQWQSELLAGEHGEQLWKYWRERLAGELPTLALPATRPRPVTQTFNGAEHSFEIDADQTTALREIARAHGVTLQVVLLAAYIAVLHRYSGQDDIIVGSPVAGRGMPGSENIVGYFVNSVALRTDLTDNPSFATLLERTRISVLEAIAHQELPFALLAEELVPARDPAFSPLFQVFFAWETSRLTMSSAAGAVVSEADFEPLSLRQGGAPVDLMLMIAEREDTLSSILQYNRDLFDAAMIDRFAAHLRHFLRAVVTDPAQSIGQVPLLTDAEVMQRVRWNDTAVPDFRESRLLDLVTAQIQRTPSAIAVSFRDRDLTYREVGERAMVLAARLHAAGARPGDVVGIAIERSEMSVVSALAVLSAGGAFLPVDPTHPSQRLRAIGAEADVVVWITDSRLRHRLPTGAITVLVDEPGTVQEFVPPTDSVSPDSAAYIMFTSGTTGRPKGAVNTHRGISNRLLWMQRAYPLSERDVVLHKTPANFDVSVWELFWPLLAGARVVVAEPERHRDSGYLVDVITRYQVTVSHFVPSMLGAFLTDPGAGRCTSLRTVVTSGEALTAELRDTLFATLSAELHNLYGPTEAAIDVTYFDCVRGDVDPIIPIGRPIANTQIHVVDGNLNPVPVGVVGELYIGGIGVAAGYLNRPELTSARFIDAGRPRENHALAYPHGLVYRTGDLARYRANGEIEYLGRADDQVKIRGVRIELGEIEGALQAHPQVRACVVVVRGSAAPKLVAYVVATDPTDPASTTTLRAFLRGSLPDAMIPAQFVGIDQIPTTATGKRDIRALPEPDTARPDIASAYQAPRTEHERVLAGLWQQVLGLDAVGVFDDYFELGGASTQTMQICAGARELGITVTPELVFRHRTVAGLAGALEPHPLPAPVVEAPSPVAEPMAPTPAAQPRTAGNTVIESLGVFLPETVRKTSEIVDGCDRPVEIPLEQLTGITTRRVVGPGEFTIDLAERAAVKCLLGSVYSASDIDLLICTNISNNEGPDGRLIFEPNTATRLRARLGIHAALSFDVSNACAGMFTGIAIADAFLATGRARTAMVVSGEYVSHIIDTAQREIVDFLDDRLACLTVGDAGAAVILHRGASAGIGFHDLRLRTLSRYSDLCIGKRTDQPHGGAIMRTKAVEQTAVAVRKSVPFAMRMLESHGWQPESVDRIIVHQTSQASINDAMATINRLIGRQAAHPGNTVSNLEHRGNTASTTHFVAVNDLIDRGDLQSGDRILFGVTGSGQTVGAALYTFDDLPDRVREGRRGGERRESVAVSAPRRTDIRVRVDAVALAHPEGEDTSVELATCAGRQCIEESSRSAHDLGLVIYAGALRDDYLVEPATATFVADRLEINADPDDPFDHATLALDLFDGGTGFLKACCAASTAIENDMTDAALVVAAEADPSVPSESAARRGVRHVGSSVILVAGAADGPGFGAFHFAAHPEYLGAVTSFTRVRGETGLEFEQDPDVEAIYLKVIEEALGALLSTASIGLDDIDVVLAPQISTRFLDAVAERIGVDRARLVDVVDGGPDLYTSSIPAALRHCAETGAAGPRDLGVIIAVGAGVQVGCALYHF